MDSTLYSSIVVYMMMVIMNPYRLPLWVKDTLGPTILFLACREAVLFSQVEMYYIIIILFEDIGRFLCKEVVPFLDGPLLEVPLWYYYQRSHGFTIIIIIMWSSMYNHVWWIPFFWAFKECCLLLLFIVIRWNRDSCGESCQWCCQR